jgi:hypothetical protein
VTNKFGLAGPDSKFKLPDAEPAGFWTGLWHGSILPIAFIASLFKPGVGIYEMNNNGGWYNFGFLLGASSSLGGGAKMQIQASRDETDGDECEDEKAAVKKFKVEFKRKAKEETDES